MGLRPRLVFDRLVWSRTYLCGPRPSCLHYKLMQISLFLSLFMFSSHHVTTGYPREFRLSMNFIEHGGRQMSTDVIKIPDTESNCNTFYMKIAWDPEMPIPMCLKLVRFHGNLVGIYQPTFNFELSLDGIGAYTEWKPYTSPGGESILALFVIDGVDLDNLRDMDSSLLYTIDGPASFRSWTRIARTAQRLAPDDPYAGVTAAVEKCLNGSERRIIGAFLRNARIDSLKQRESEEKQKEKEEKAALLASIQSIQSLVQNQPTVVTMAPPAQMLPPAPQPVQVVPDSAHLLTPRSVRRRLREQFDSDTDDNDADGLRAAALKILGTSQPRRHSRY